MTAPIHDIAERIYEDLALRLQDVWARGLTAEDRALLMRCCTDAAELHVRALAAPQTTEVQLALLREKAHIHAQLANIAAAAQVRLAATFWEVVKTVVNGAVAIAFAAV